MIYLPQHLALSRMKSGPATAQPEPRLQPPPPKLPTTVATDEDVPFEPYLDYVLIRMTYDTLGTGVVVKTGPKASSSLVGKRVYVGMVIYGWSGTFYDGDVQYNVVHQSEIVGYVPEEKNPRCRCLN